MPATRCLVPAVAVAALVLTVTPAQAQVLPTPVPLSSSATGQPWVVQIAGQTNGSVVISRLDPHQDRGLLGPQEAVVVATGAHHPLGLSRSFLLRAAAGAALVTSYEGQPDVWEDLTSGTTGTVASVSGERYGDRGLLFITGGHLVARSLAGADTDLGSGFLSDARILDANGETVVVQNGHALRRLGDGTWSDTTLPTAANCVSVTTAALGCYTDSTVYRVPLDGGAAVSTAVTGYVSDVAVTPAQTAWTQPGAAQPLRSVPAAGGPVSSSALTPDRLISVGADLVVTVSSTDPSEAGLYALTDAAATPRLLLAAGSAPVYGDDVHLTPGRAIWSDDATAGYHSRAVTAGPTLGTTTAFPTVGTILATSGRRLLFGQAEGSAQGLYVSTGGSAPVRAATAVPGTARLAGARLVYEKPGADHLTLLDLVTGTTRELAPLPNALPYHPYALGADFLAFSTLGGDVRVRDLTTLVEAAVGTYSDVQPQSGPGLVALGTKLAWTEGRTPSNASFSTVDVVAGGDPVHVSGSLLRLTDEGVLAGDVAAPKAALDLVGFDGVARHLASSAFTFPAPDAAVGNVAFLDTDRTPVIAATGASVLAPFALSPLSAPAVPKQDLSWTLDLPTSAPLSTCTLTLTDQAGAVVRQPACDSTALAEGEVVAQTSLAGLPVGAYAWTLAAGTFSQSGTVYRPTSVTITQSPAPTDVPLGGIATLTAAATSTPASTVQWQRKLATESAFTPVAGATSTTLRVRATPGVNRALYRAVFTNGYATVATDAAKVTIPSAPRITAQPKGTTVAAKKVAAFSSSAVGEPPPTRTWQISVDDGRTWRTVGGATGATYALVATKERNGWWVRAVYANSHGTVRSAAAVLIVR